MQVLCPLMQEAKLNFEKIRSFDIDPKFGKLQKYPTQN